MAKEGEETKEKEVMEAAPPVAAENKEEENEVVHADTTTVADKEEVQKERAAPSGEKPRPTRKLWHRHLHRHLRRPRPGPLPPRSTTLRMWTSSPSTSRTMPPRTKVSFT